MFDTSCSTLIKLMKSIYSSYLFYHSCITTVVVLVQCSWPSISIFEH